MRINTILLFFILGFISCNKSNDPVVVKDYNLTVGQKNIYKVASETYSLTIPADTSVYYIMENILSKTASTDETKYTVEQFKKYKLTDNWIPFGLFTIIKNSTAVIRYDDNIPNQIIKMPISTDNKWNLNEFNNNSATTLSYKNINRNYQNYSNTFQVFQDSDSSLINLKKHYSIYSYNEGLIYKESTTLNYCQTSAECIGSGKISYGTRQIWTKIQ